MSHMTKKALSLPVWYVDCPRMVGRSSNGHTLPVILSIEALHAIPRSVSAQGYVDSAAQ